MKLYIDTTDGEEIVIGIGDKRYKTKSKKEKSQRLLPLIDEKLKENG
jgi:tRNA A37 threonylcarbamoyladenosine modification protein TsaB